MNKKVIVDTEDKNLSSQLHILIVEDNKDDVDLLLRELRKIPMDFSFKTVETSEEFQRSLTEKTPDIILSDYSLPAFDGLSAYKIKQNIFPEIPFLIISGIIGDENAVELIKNGITDYVLKDKIYSLVPKITRALHEANEKKEKIISDEKIKVQSIKMLEIPFLKQIMETSQEGIWLLDENNLTTYVNNKLCVLLEYSSEEMMGKDIYFFMDDEGKKIAAIAKAERDIGVNANHDFKYITKSGLEVWAKVSANIIQDESGNYKGSLGMISDITYKKSLEDLLDKATKMARIGSYEINFQNKSLYWSPITKELHGVSENYIPDLTNVINFYKEGLSRNTITEKVKNAIKFNHSFDVELQIITAKGNESWVRAIGVPEIKNNICIKLSGSFQDINARKIAENELLNVNKSLEIQAIDLATSNNELEQFAFVASHDLQEPLRSVTSFLQLLEKKYDGVLDEKGKQYLKFAVDGASRMKILINDLLEFSMLVNSQSKLEVTDLNGLVSEIKILLQDQIANKNVIIESELLPSLHLNKTPIRQVFQNLIANAIKYQKKGINPVIGISCKEKEDDWEFSISDNGIGIPEKYQEKIFVIFQRLNNSSEYSGTGMGLAVTKKIIENHRGRIWVTSEVDKGSTFYFTLPK